MQDFRKLMVWQKAHELVLARDLNYLERTRYDGLEHDLDEVKRMLTGLIQSIEAKS